MASTENATSSDKDAPDADDKKTVVTSQAPSVVAKAEKSEPGAAWKADEEHVLPHNNMVLVFSALMLTLFLVCVLAMALAIELYLRHTSLLRRRWIKQCRRVLLREFACPVDSQKVLPLPCPPL